jgi:leucyl-tRNA synthetase
MDTFVDSSWYFFRYCDPRNETSPFDPKHRGALDAGRSIHRWRLACSDALIYTRFWTKVMRDLGLVKFNEPVKRLLTQGMVTNRSRRHERVQSDVKVAGQWR